MLFRLLARLEQLLGDREDVLLDHLLHERRDEVVVDDDDAVDLTARVEVGDGMRERLRVVVRGPVAEAGPRLDDLVAAEAQGRDALPAGRQPAHALPLCPELPVEGEGVAKHLRVERAGETAVAGQRQDRDGPLLLVTLEERQPAHRRAGAGRADHQLHHPVGIRPHRLDPRLRTPEPRGCHQLHGFGDLPRVADRPDSPLQVLDRGHAVSLSLVSVRKRATLPLGR